MKEGKMGSIKKIYFILIVIFVFSSTTYAVDRMDVKPTRDQKIKIYRQFLKESKSTSNLELYVNKFFKYLPKETKDLSYKSIRAHKAKLSKVQLSKINIEDDKIVIRSNQKKDKLTLDVVSVIPRIISINGIHVTLAEHENIETLAEKIKIAGKFKSSSFNYLMDLLFPKAEAILPALGLGVVLEIAGISITTTDVIAALGMSAYFYGAFDEEIDYKEEMKKVINVISKEHFSGQISGFEVKCSSPTMGGGSTAYLRVYDEEGNAIMMSDPNVANRYLKGQRVYMLSKDGKGKSFHGILDMADISEVSPAFTKYGDINLVKNLGMVLDHCCKEGSNCPSQVNSMRFRKSGEELVFDGDQVPPAGTETLKGTN